MFKNYYIIAVRNALKSKYYFLINVFGLSLSLFCCILIMLWAQDELSFDQYNINSKNIYRIVQEGSIEGKKAISALTPPQLANKIQNGFSEVIDVTRFYDISALVKYDEKIFAESRLSFADPSFLKMFTLNFVNGNIQTALKEPHSIIITKKIAGQIFGNEDPIGKVLEVDSKYNLKITGVIENIPGNSSLQFDLLTSLDLLKQSGINLDDWRYTEFLTFVMLKPGSSFQAFNEKLNAAIRNDFPEKKEKYILQSLNDIHLYSSTILYDPLKHGELKYVKVFIIAGLLMLAIACINFINLTTASSFTRFKEIGVRKILGADRKNLIIQFISESGFVFVVSLIIAICLVQIIMPSYNNFIGKELNFFSSNNLPLYIILVLITLFSCVASSNYPAVILSKYKRSVISQFRIKQGGTGLSYRKILVTSQFILSAFFIIAMITINRQNNYLQTKKMGFDKEHLIYIPFQIREDSESNYNMIKNELLKNPNVKGVSTANNIFTGLYSGFPDIKWEGQNPEDKATVYLCTGGFDFIETTGMKIIDGRSFSKEIPADLNRSIILNQKAVKTMNLNSPIGKTISFFGDKTIVGVVEDFHFKSLYQEVEPIMMLINPVCRYIFIRVGSNDISSTIQFIESVWKKELPERPFSFNFLEETINNQYKSEQQLGIIINYFAMFAIFISSLGLFGLVFFMTERRKKEIGVRKILGASITSIVFMLTRDFTKWILIANLIAWPISYYLLKKWLQDFAYRIEISWWIFVAAGCIALAISLAIISIQAIKAATTNPVDELRYE